MQKKVLNIIFLLALCISISGCKETDYPQLTKIAAGEEIAVVKTSMGTIKLRFFPEYAPKAVENFKTHAQNGYYDGVIFHRVIKDFMIQGGDPLGTGTGGESIWGGKFDVEVSQSLRHFRGALSMANSGVSNSNGSQFFIVQGQELDKQRLDYLKDPSKILGPDQSGKEWSYGDWYFKDNYKKYKPLFSDKVIEAYAEIGGQPELDYGYTVFGQVVEGMEVVDAIAKVATENDRPFDDVVIESISFEVWQ